MSTTRSWTEFQLTLTSSEQRRFFLQASYGVEDPEYAVTQLAQTTMRSELGKLTLDKVFRVMCASPPAGAGGWGQKRS